MAYLKGNPPLHSNQMLQVMEGFFCLIGHFSFVMYYREPLHYVNPEVLDKVMVSDKPPPPLNGRRPHSSHAHFSRPRLPGTRSKSATVLVTKNVRPCD